MAKRQRFRTWCKRDPNDETKICYSFEDVHGNVQHFTSEDVVPFDMIFRIGDAWIESIEYYEDDKSCPNGEWHVVLYEET